MHSLTLDFVSVFVVDSSSSHHHPQPNIITIIINHQAHNPRRAHAAISSGVLTPAALFQAFFQSYLPIGQHPKRGVDYLASLNLHWFDHVSGKDASLFETQKLKCQKSKAEVFQMLLMNMARDQLTELVGTPREDVRPGEGVFNLHISVLVIHIYIKPSTDSHQYPH